MTPEQIIYQRRVRLLALADELGNISEACRLVGVSRTSFYEWQDLARALRARRVDAQVEAGRPSCPTPPRHTWSRTC